MNRLHESLSVGKTLTRLSVGAFFLFAMTFAATNAVMAQSFTEGFDTVTTNSTTPLPNWVAVNNSSPAGGTLWFQGNPAVFPAQAGATTDSYIGSNYNGTTGTGTISNWLIAPVRTFNNGDTISFYTRTTDVGAAVYPDRLQLRLSTAGASTNTGGTSTSVGDFSNLLLDINPTLVDAYPHVWTQYTVTISGLAGATSGRFAFRYFVTSGGSTGSNSDYMGIDTLAYTSNAAPPKSPLDFDGDGKTDWSVVRNTGGGQSGQATWFNCINGVAEPGCLQARQWGIASDFFVPADFDGDGKADIAVWRAGDLGYFYIFQSATSTVRTDQFGQTGDDPSVIADYTGDGKADPAVYRGGASAGAQSFFFYRASSGPYAGGVVYEPWGSNGDYPAPGDYDGDGKADFMVQRNGGAGQATFYLRTNTTNNVSSFNFGIPTDVIVPGDYDGDGKTDIAVVRGVNGNLNWYVRSSANPGANPTGFVATFGSVGSDFLTPGDYDGDGKSDIAVWRPNADPTQNFFYVLGSSSGNLITKEWGSNGDYPTANYNAH
ncbi:MAG: choice-of-anchor J domain-containing protein [Acidobacteriota bacterium]